ncbi:membrane dipeptidase [Microbulbifer sp. ANSA003]|uniref:membrane dipeptidase n=1 Tax=Microbulbifer sp. ANSA003 TaxID=3243360 RepID=UPI004041BB1C
MDKLKLNSIVKIYYGSLGKLFIFAAINCIAGTVTAAPYFDKSSLQPGVCSTKGGYRWYAARLYGGEGSRWEDECWTTTITINNTYFKRPHYCRDYSGSTGTWGEWAVPDARCGSTSIHEMGGKWRALKRQNCGTNDEWETSGAVNAGARGYRKYYAWLDHKNESSADWLATCAHWPINIAGVEFGKGGSNSQSELGWRACFPGAIGRNSVFNTHAEFWIKDSTCNGNFATPERGNGSGLVSNTPLNGYADLHAHPFAYKAFGGGIFGSVRGTVAEAFQNHNHDLLEKHPWFTWTWRVQSARGLLDQLWLAGGRWDSDVVPWDRHSTGYPDFTTTSWSDNPGNAWPRVWEDAHVKMHNHWLRRANIGGLRLMIAFANNHGLNWNGRDADETRLPDIAKGPAYMGELETDLNGDGEKNKWDIDDWGALLGQTEEMHKLAQEHEWIELVSDAKEARAAVEAGKLAMVWGSEIDQAFNCKESWSTAWGAASAKVCDQRDIDKAAMVHEMLRIRAVFPVHVKANGLGHPAFNSPLVFQGPTWSEGYEACRDYQGMAAFNEDTNPDMGVCSSGGLSDLGRHAILKSWSLGHMIDVGHMGKYTFNSTLALADTYNVPVVHGHSGVFATAADSRRYEGNTGKYQFKKIASVGGMVGAIEFQGDQSLTTNYVHASIPDTVGGSASSWSQAYEYINDLEGFGVKQDSITKEYYGTVAIGTDFNGGIAHAIGRKQHYYFRFPFDQQIAWWGSAGTKVTKYVEYPFDLPEQLMGAYCNSQGSECDLSINQLQPGLKLSKASMSLLDLTGVDYNDRGLATVGQLPDFIEDLRVQGMPLAKLESFYRSAMGYVNMWDRAEKSAKEDVYWFSTSLYNDYSKVNFPLRKDAGTEGEVKIQSEGTNSAPVCRAVIRDANNKFVRYAPGVSVTRNNVKACVTNRGSAEGSWTVKFVTEFDEFFSREGSSAKWVAITETGGVDNKLSPVYINPNNINAIIGTDGKLCKVGSAVGFVADTGECFAVSYDAQINTVVEVVSTSDYELFYARIPVQKKQVSLQIP